MEISPGQWERVKDLYHAALTREASEREAFLQGESDEHVRFEVERLLREQEKLGDFLSTPPHVGRDIPEGPEREHIAPGELLAGRFRIVGFIAAGGMGQVYKTQDTRLGRMVALKFLPKELAEDRLSLERFRREAQAASALNDPNICTIYDFGEDGGRAFIAMEYLEGETLSARIKRGPVAVENAVKIAIAVTRALNAAHRKGIIHRDLKPSNVMLTETGVKLLDFGLAKNELQVVASEKTVTALNIEVRFAGTLPYMSPEQLDGAEVDARCDIFAFGAVTYEMLTGKRAFERGSSSETILAVDREEPTPIRELVKEVPEDLEEIVRRCLRKQAVERYGSVAEIQRDLEFWLAKVSQPTSGLNLKALQQRSNRARSALPLIVGSVLALLVSATGVAVHFILKPEPQPRIVGAHALTKTGNTKGDFYGGLFVDRDSIYFDDEAPTGSVMLAVPAAGGEVSAGPPVNGFLTDVSRDGSSRLLFLTYDPKRKQHDVWTQSLPAGAPRLIVQDACDAHWIDEGNISFFRCEQNKVELYRASTDGTGVQRLATVPVPFVVGQPNVSPDGESIRFTGSPDDTYPLWEIGKDGRNLQQILGGRKDVYGGSWSPNGKYYFFSSWDGERWSLSAVSEAHHGQKKVGVSQPYPLTFGPMSIGLPAISNDGKRLYAVAKEPHGELSVYDSKARKFVPYLGGISICYVDFSRDGQWIAYVSYPEGTLWRSRIDGSERRQLTVPPVGVMNPRWSPDRKLILFTDTSNGDRHKVTYDRASRVYVVSADGGGSELLLAGHFSDPTWSSDGSSIAYSYGTATTQAGSEVRILDLQTRKSTTVPGSESMWSPRWSPDGKYLVALLAWPAKKLMIFNFVSNTWEELASGDFAWPSWSRDSKFVYAVDGDSMIRIAISDHKKAQIASLQGFRGTAYYLDKWNTGWFGVAPDGRPITTRDTGIEEIYDFELEYK